MPNALPPPEGVKDCVLFEDKNRFLVKFLESNPKSHEIQYMKQMYGFEDFRYALHCGIADDWSPSKELKRYSFLLKNFQKARRQAVKTVSTRLAVGLLILVPFLL